jgi:hypothetical protein
MGVRHGNRLHDRCAVDSRAPIDGQIIYYSISGVIGACRQAPYKFKKSYGGGFGLGAPIVSTLRTVKPPIFTYIGGSGTAVPVNASYRTTRG